MAHVSRALGRTMLVYNTDLIFLHIMWTHLFAPLP